VSRRNQLPPTSSVSQKLLYPLIRSFFYFFFTYLPYAPIRRINKPPIRSPYLWACSHSNFLCDTIPAGYEGPIPTKFLAKSTLFVFPIKWIVTFCGGLPVARAEDFKNRSASARVAQNRSTFKVAIQAINQGWPVAVFPEGMSITSPGLVLPLKPGIAKLGFGAESAADFNLGLELIPVGLEYGSRTRVGSGLWIRFGTPIRFQDYRSLFETDEPQAVRKLMNDLTDQMISLYPHFESETDLALGRKLVNLGIARSKFAVSELLRKRKDQPQFREGINAILKKFEEANREAGIPFPAWGHRRIWKDLSPRRQANRRFWIFAGAPLALVDAINSAIPELFLSTAVDLISVDDTEKMSYRFMLSPVVLMPTYALQFWFMERILWPPEAGLSGGTWMISYLVYTLASFCIWYGAVHWRRQFKRWFGLYYFRRAKGTAALSASVAAYGELRQYLGELQNHRG
jgi:1-acyl-sn-glycerol-3-phosphate acyltransferase